MILNDAYKTKQILKYLYGNPKDKTDNFKQL